MKIEIEQNYNKVVTIIKEDINKTQLDIMMNANVNLVNLYFRIGKVLYDNSSWGNKFIDKVSFELREAYSNQKGFSVRNLKYMKTFYEEYKDKKEFVQLVAQIPWTHNIILIEKVNNIFERKWYIENCIKEGWSKSILIYQINTNLYYRQIKNIKHNNFGIVMKNNSELATSILKDPYIFDMLELSDDYKERELENKLMSRLKNVLLELGEGFSFIGNQYKLVVGNRDFYVDMLFYHTKLKCYIAIELKIKEFEPEFGSKMSFYLAALDEQLKGEDDNPSIGLILCESKNNTIVDYTLKYINKPVGVSEYKIYDKLPKRYIGKLPENNDLKEKLERNEIINE